MCHDTRERKPLDCRVHSAGLEHVDHIVDRQVLPENPIECTRLTTDACAMLFEGCRTDDGKSACCLGVYT